MELNTKIIGDINEINFNDVKVGDQYIVIKDDSNFDSHDIYWVVYTKQNYLYHLRRLGLRYQSSDVKTFCNTNELIFNINNHKILINESEDYNDLFFNAGLSDLFNYIDMDYLKNNQTGKFVIGKHRLFYYKLPLDELELLILYDIQLNDQFIDKRFYFGIISAKFTFKVFNVQDPELFIKFLINNTNDQGLIQFKSDIIDKLDYNINDYIKGKDNSEFLNLLSVKDNNGGTIDKVLPDCNLYFKPIFQKDSIRFFLDYYNKSNKLIIAYNNSITSFVSENYQRIFKALNKYYYTDSSFYPFTENNDFMDKNDNYTFEHIDCEGLMLRNCFGEAIFKTIIDGIALNATTKERDDILDRKQTIDILTTSN